MLPSLNGACRILIIRVTVTEKRKVLKLSAIFQPFLKFHDEWELFEDVID